MKRNLFYFITFVVIFMIASCSLFEGEVDETETTSFITDLESTASGDIEVGGENTALVEAASSDFYTKGGTAINYMVPFSYLNTNKPAKLLMDTTYGTYEYQYNSEYGYYEWVCTDESYPSNGYLYKWTFEDTAGTTHNAELLFDEITYYSGDPDEYTPTNLDITLSIDNDSLAQLHYEANYQTVTGEYGDEYWPIEATVSLEIYDEVKITFSYEGEVTEDEEGDPTMDINTFSLKLEDFVNDEWVEYTVTSTGEKTVNFVMENNEGWKIDIDTEEPIETIEDDIEYTRIDFAGELTKDNNHAADLDGVIWEPSDYFTHRSYMIATYPTGDADTIYFNVPTEAKDFSLK